MPTVLGWVFVDSVVQFLQLVSHYIRYAYDDLDEAALTGALQRTDDESIDGWFSYPLPGTPPLTVSLARAVGGGEVSVQVGGDIDPVLRVRFETLFDLL